MRIAVGKPGLRLLRGQLTKETKFDPILDIILSNSMTFRGYDLETNTGVVVCQLPVKYYSFKMIYISRSQNVQLRYQIIKAIKHFFKQLNREFKV